MLNNKNIKAFTLVELSIVLVVIALLVGGVLAGQDVLTATKRNSIITETQTFRTAIANFKTKYFNNIPGDFDEAEKFWTSAMATDGDGNGKVTKNVDDPGESLLVWQHLTLAAMLPGNYTGAMATGDLMVVDENVPGSDFAKDLGYNVFSVTEAAGMSDTRANALKNIIFVGGCSGQVVDDTEYCAGPVLTPTDSYNIDIKIDDGVAQTGRVIGLSSATSATTSCSQGLLEDFDSVDYNLDNNVKACILMMEFSELN